MSKKDFLKELKRALSPLPAKEKKERLSFYSEIIDDKIEEGASENIAVAEAGSAAEIAAKILSESKNAAGEGTHKKLQKSTAEKIVMIVGAPLWIPIAICCAAVVFSGYLVAYALLLALWAIELPFLLMALLSKGLLPTCLVATKALASFTSSSLKKIIHPFKR